MGVFDQDVFFVENGLADASGETTCCQEKNVEENRDKNLCGEVSGNWSINGNPNGGYLMGILAKAILSHSEKKLMSIFTANFMSRCQSGQAVASIKPIGSTRSFERWQGTLFSSGKERIYAMGTLSNPGATGIKEYQRSPLELAPVDDCVVIPGLPGYTIFDHMDVRLDPDCAGWITDGKLSSRAEQKGWIRFRDDRPFDQAALMMVADTFPPAVLCKYGMTAWVPTLELSVNIRSVPETKWLKCRFRSRFNTFGIVEEDGEIWDEDGELVAISRQISNFIKN